MRYTIFSLLGMALAACTGGGRGNLPPAVHLTFDDVYTHEWYAADTLFARYGARCTFFLTHLHQLDSSDYARMLWLQQQGHEIGCHGLSHAQPVQYIDSAGIEAYLKVEVDSAIAMLRAKGFSISTFAFPHGVYSQALADSLCARGLRLRGGIYNQTSWLHRRPRTFDKLDIYRTEPGQCLTEAMGIDRIFNNTMHHILAGIRHCATHQKALVVYAHRINDAGERYSVHPALLDSILKAGTKLGVAFVPFGEGE